MTLKLLPLPALLMAGLAASAPAAHAAGGCSSRIVDFDATRVALHERVASDWHYGTEDLNGRAALSTVQTSSLHWRGRMRAAATFNELSRGCRLADLFQGKVKIPLRGIAGHMKGSWSAGQRSGSCDTRRKLHGRAKADFIRRSRRIRPGARSVKLAWSPTVLRSLDCPFDAYESEFGVYSREHLRATFDVPGRTQVVRKSRLLGHRRTLRLHVHVHRALEGRHAGWSQGRLGGALDYDLTVVLKRVKDCTIGPHDPIAGNRCLRPA
jgi:hypothetical protein